MRVSKITIVAASSAGKQVFTAEFLKEVVYLLIYLLQIIARLVFPHINIIKVLILLGALVSYINLMGLT